MSKSIRDVRLVAFVSLFALGTIAGCADAGTDHPPARDAGHGDGGPMDAGDAGGDTGIRACMTNADCGDDHIFCNGVLQCTGGRCVAANVPSCSDSITCTDDHCDGTSDVCVHVPNDANCGAGLHCAISGCVTGVPCEFDGTCDDHIYCNGAESCVAGVCNTSGMRNCDDGMSCTLDSCSETAAACTHMPYADAATSVDHCGDGTTCIACPMPPAAMHQVATCTTGICGLVCVAGYYDGDGMASNGCEFMCTPTGTGIDDPDVVGDSDCDGFEGTVTDGVFVATSGNDANPGTRAMPMLTIGAGIGRAVTMGKHSVFVSEGIYNEAVSMQNGISIFGGYSASHAWARNGSYTSTIRNGTVSSNRIVGVSGVGINTPTRLSQMTVTTLSTAVAGVTNYGLYCDTCTGLTVRSCTITAGSGGVGTDGGSGGAGGTGTGGGSGAGSSCDNNVAGAAGGPGGGSGCGRSGGNGGNGGNYGSNSGSPGGGGVGGTPGGGGGSGGSTGGPGGNGSNGATGGAGASGTGGNGGNTATGFWVSTPGGAGVTGSPGNGGGGGGGGGGQGCTFCDDGPGNGGGGGGGGGCGGTGGTAGTGGGGSFGIFLRNSTGIVLESNSVTSGNGGVGGRGGNGGGGGVGAGGAAGGQVCTGEVGGGGTGGAGGAGGSGGAGGGGAGGPSYAVYRLGTTVATAGNVLVAGIGGAGGSSPGNAGVTGASASLF